MIRRPPRSTLFPYTTLVGARRREGKREAGAGRIVEHDVFVRRAGDAGQPRHRDLQVSGAGRAEVPAVRDDRIALAHDEAVPGMRRSGRIVRQGGLVQPAQTHLAAVVEVEQHLLVALAEIDGLQDEDVHRVLDHAGGGIARRELDAGDALVARVIRVELAKGGAAQLLVLADRAEAQAAEGWRLPGEIGRRLRAGWVE